MPTKLQLVRYDDRIPRDGTPFHMPHGEVQDLGYLIDEPVDALRYFVGKAIYPIANYRGIARPFDHEGVPEGAQGLVILAVSDDCSLADRPYLPRTVRIDSRLTREGISSGLRRHISNHYRFPGLGDDLVTAVTFALVAGGINERRSVQYSSEMRQVETRLLEAAQAGLGLTSLPTWEEVEHHLYASERV